VSVVRGARARERPQETARALRALLLRCFRIFGLRGRWPSVRVEEECVRPSWRRARRPEGCAERPQHGAVLDAAVRTRTRRGRSLSRGLLQWLAPSLWVVALIQGRGQSPSLAANQPQTTVSYCSTDRCATPRRDNGAELTDRQTERDCGTAQSASCFLFLPWRRKMPLSLST
jgi:hypothetical protein